MVAYANPLVANEVPVISFWFITKVEKSGLADSCTEYEVAPFEVFQLNVGEFDTSADPFTGEVIVGCTGTLSIVVKEYVADQAPVPDIFVADTRQ